MLHNIYIVVCTDTKTTLESSYICENDYYQLLCSMVYVRISVAGKEGHKVSICSTRRGPQFLRYQGEADKEVFFDGEDFDCMLTSIEDMCENNQHPIQRDETLNLYC